MKQFLPVVLACSSLLAAPLFTPEALRLSTADVQAQDATAVPDSPAGLQEQLGEIVKIKPKKELKRREQLISELRIPDPDAWFANTFGNDDGAKLAAKYKNSWEKFDDSFTNIVTNLAEDEETHISVKEISLPAKPAVPGQNESTATDVRPP